MKKLLLLGGDSLLLPIIKEAKSRGYYVITCDYLPDNIAHKYSDEYINHSTTDKEEILEWARQNAIDGVATFTDSGAVTAAYVSEKLRLPYQCSFEAASILQDKSLFRKFLTEHGFNCPHAKGYSHIEDALNDVDYYTWPVIVKPVDSAGSKGVMRVNTPEELENAIKKALVFSQKKQFIIEDFLEKEGFSCGSESFAVNGKIVFNGIYDQYFDDEASNPYIPSAEVWPSSLKAEYKEEMKSELQRLFTLLGVGTGLFNIEFRLCKNGKLYLMEVSPRAGGNRLAEMLIHATGTNLIEAELNKAVGLSVAEMTEAQYHAHHAILVLHSTKGGIFQGISLDEKFEQQHILDKQIRMKLGDQVAAFTGANALIGTLFLKFDTREELATALANQQNWVSISIK